MSKKLRIALSDEEFLQIQTEARLHRLSVEEWVRQALALTCQQHSFSDIARKLAVIREAARHNFPLDAQLLAMGHERDI